VGFFTLYPLQSYKHQEFIIWRKYIEGLEADQASNAQRQLEHVDRSDYYINLTLRLSKLQSGR
jgi:hypothetical protein